MYNCFFGMPYRRNPPYYNVSNRNSQPVQPKTNTPKQYIPNELPHVDNFSTANKLLIKHSHSGGIVLPEDTDKIATYIVASINLDTSAYRNFLIHFNFSCNIATTRAGLHLRFQLFKQEKNQVSRVPVSSSYIYNRITNSTDTNTFSFIACDSDSMKFKYCNYSVYVEIMSFRTVGTIMITNPLLIASIIENNKEIE